MRGAVSRPYGRTDTTPRGRRTAMTQLTGGPRAATRYLVVGGLCGLAWAAGLRGWMAQLAAGGSNVTWLTLVLVLLPGTIIGALLGWSAYLRSKGVRGSRWLVFSPVLFASALLDPEIFLRSDHGRHRCWGAHRHRDRTLHRLRAVASSLVDPPGGLRSRRGPRPAADRGHGRNGRADEHSARGVGQPLRLRPGPAIRPGRGAPLPADAKNTRFAGPRSLDDG